MSSEIKRGLVVEVNWEPRRGSEQGGIRPSVIIQNDIGNKYSPTTIVAASTTAAINPSYPFIVSLKAGEGGLPQDSTINCSSILTIDKTCIIKKYGFVSKNKMHEIDNAILCSLGIKVT